MPCPSCDAKLGLFHAKKRTCDNCTKTICTKCLTKETINVGAGESGRRRKIRKTILCSDCHSVHVVTGMNQEDLNSAPEQQLRQFLTAMDVSSEDSVERDDLVTLVQDTIAATAAAAAAAPLRDDDGDDEFVTAATAAATAASATSATASASASASASGLPGAPGAASADGARAASGGAGSSAGLGGDWASRLGAGFETFLADQLLSTLLGSVNADQSEAEVKREQAAKRKQHQEMLEERANARILATAKSADDFGKLRVVQLKSILKQNYIEHDGCVEKQELVTLVVELWEVRQKEEAAPKAEICKVCMDQAVSCVFLECGHFVCCSDCGKQVEDCPICRQPITRVVPVFRS